MSDYHRTPTTPTSRKDRRCIACYGKIAKGEVYTQQTGYFDGEAYRNHFHNECWQVLCDEGVIDFTPGRLDRPYGVEHFEGRA